MDREKEQQTKKAKAFIFAEDSMQYFFPIEFLLKSPV